METPETGYLLWVPEGDLSDQMYALLDGNTECAIDFQLRPGDARPNVTMCIDGRTYQCSTATLPTLLEMYTQKEGNLYHKVGTICDQITVDGECDEMSGISPLTANVQEQWLQQQPITKADVEALEKHFFDSLETATSVLYKVVEEVSFDRSGEVVDRQVVSVKEKRLKMGTTKEAGDTLCKVTYRLVEENVGSGRSQRAPRSGAQAVFQGVQPRFSKSSCTLVSYVRDLLNYKTPLHPPACASNRSTGTASLHEPHTT